MIESHTRCSELVIFQFENNKYIYNYTDHLGNVRLSFLDNGSRAEVLEENNYYPFGLKHEGYNVLAGNPTNQYKYNGKELQETGFYDYGWRQYMPDIARWNGMDQLSEKFISTSPYAYVANNPISFVDPDGMDIKPTSNGWDFTGSDINTVMGYLNGGNSARKMVSALSAWGDGGGNDNFWSYFGSYNSWGGSRDAGGNIYATIARDGALGNSQNQIQEIIWSRTKLVSIQSSEDWLAESAKAARQPGKAWMIGGTGDFTGIFDIGGQYLSTLEPENQYLAMGIGLFAAIAAKKPGLIKGEYNMTSTAVRSALSNRIGKRGFSEVGYQFQKHYGRGGNWAIPHGVTQNPAMFNQVGYQTFKEIWKAPGSFQSVGGFIEKRLLDGRGIRFQENWEFKGFLD